MAVIPTRHKMVFGTFILAMIVLFDRILISVAKDPVASDLNLSDKQMGWVLSIFALGYALFQTPSGYLADKYGPRKILTAVVSLWSFFTAITGAVSHFITLLVVRFLFGVGEAGAFPGMARAIYTWIPLRERGLVNGINFSGGRIGAAIALPLVAWLIELTSWRMSFVILGVIGIIWALIWYWWFRDAPEDHPSITDQELRHIQSNIQAKETGDTGSASMKSLFGNKTMWLLMGQYFSSNFTFFFCLTWLFPHLKAKYQLDALEAGFYSSAPLMFGALGNWTSGWLVDFVFKRGKWSLSRKLPAIIGFTLAAVGVIASIYMSDVTAAVIFISMAVFGADMTLSPSWSACVDVGQAHSGTVSGTMNMAGNLGSFFTALAFPYMLELTGSDIPFFYLTASLNLLTIPLWLAINPEKPIQLTKT
ncbi:MFS transporter [Marinoscillum furvescens]|uniref:ACS family glucarate transporter-like MFS transporter n=1 Tax=Marinoscillum furvescens DSM 4134 TaxID=1122208 RepID=A0A3D9L1Q7_MARFU|nr:MFS transporter [Marinoscillum furvescens]RED95667.1 ACS family glucarate transporter-like MFS transporter [Marinoscillum furvescens DSM 4134]